MKCLNLKKTALLILTLAASQSASAVEIPDGVFYDQNPAVKLDLICSRDWDIQSCTLAPDFREQFDEAKKGFFGKSEDRARVLTALRQEALDSAELYKARSSKYVGKSKILTSLYDEAQREILKSDYLIELNAAIDANAPSSEAHEQFQKIEELANQFEAASQLPVSERRKVRAELLEKYNAAQDRLLTLWTVVNSPTENFPRLNPKVRPVADSSVLNSNASLELVVGYRLVPDDTDYSEGHIILGTDRKLLEAMVLDSNGRENPIRLDEKELGLFGSTQLSYDAAKRTLTHRYRYDSNRITSLKGKSLKDHLKAFLGVK